jgi:hypothetical protein
MLGIVHHEEGDRVAGGRFGAGFTPPQHDDLQRLTA